MNDAQTTPTFPRFRFWSIAFVIYGVLLASLVALFLPWKTPTLNIGLITFGALHIMASPGLWKGRPWAWKLAILVSFCGFIIAVLLACGLVSSWAYLRGIFGDFGRGASIGALLFTSVVLEVFGLFPALALRRLLSKENRQAAQMGRKCLFILWGLCLLPPLSGLVINQIYSLKTISALDESQKNVAIQYVRAALRHQQSPNIESLRSIQMDGEPLYISFWNKGNLAVRVLGKGENFAQALTEATQQLVSNAYFRGRAHFGGVIKIDRVTDHGAILSQAAPIIALSVNPGIDGLRRKSLNSHVLLPDDLIKLNRFGATPLIPSIRELRLGLDVKAAQERLGADDSPIERLRTESIVEFQGRALDATRGNTPLTQKGPNAWRQAAIDGGDFILRQLMPDGRFHYQYFPLDDRHPEASDSNYSLARHAGTIYALALLYGETGFERFKAGAEKAISWLGQKIPENCGSQQRSCVIKNQRAELGGTALTMVGMLEYQRRTGDPRYAHLVRRLAQFLLDMQKENGDFYHFYHINQNEIDRQKRLMFYSEEAALALVMTHEILQEERYLEAAKRALDFLTHEKYNDFFLGKLIYGADHWTCIAAEEAWPRLQSTQYIDFCEGYAAFIRRMQYEEGAWQNADFEGHYGFGAVMVPQAPAAAGFTEAIISTAALAAHHHRPNDRLKTQVEAALNALARDQIRLDNAWLMPNPQNAKGGIRRSLVEQEVRIDFTQHAASALIRGAVFENESMQSI